MHHRKTVVHVTGNEFTAKNGIADFLDGLHSTPTYYETIERSVVIAPHPLPADDEFKQLLTKLDVQYSGIDGTSKHPLAAAFADVERKFDVRVVYALRRFQSTEKGDMPLVEYVFIQTSGANIHPVNGLKSWMFEEFSLQSDRYEHENQYETACRLAPAALAILRSLGASDPSRPTVVISHGGGGVPTMLGAVMDPLGSYKTVFCAHDVPTVRNIVRHHPGHDCIYYNAVKWGRENHYYLTEIFGSQDYLYQHALFMAARHCDNILAMSRTIKNDLHFLGPNYNMAKIDPAYRLPRLAPLDFDRKQQTHARLAGLAEQILSYRPDYIFSRITDMSVTDGLWRDLRVLYNLEDQFREADRTGVFYLVNTSPQREEIVSSKIPGAIRNRRQLQHDEHEIAFFNYIQEFNARNTHIKAIMIDERGWKEHGPLCRMPDDLDIQDLRQGGDVEFHQHIYDPTSSRALEALAYGNICVLNRICGGIGLIEATVFPKPDNVVIGDYTAIETPLLSRDALMRIKQSFRDQVEVRVAAELADTIMRRLPRDTHQREKLFSQGRLIADQMDWNAVCEKYFIPAIDRAYHKRRGRQIA